MIYSYFVEYTVRAPTVNGVINKSIVCFNNIIMPHNLEIFKRAVAKTWQDKHSGILLDSIQVEIINISFLGSKWVDKYIVLCYNRR